jgi:flagellar protein FliL
MAAEIPVLAPADPNAAPAKTGKSRMRLIIMAVAAVVVLAAGGGVAWWYSSSSAQHGGASAKEPKPAPVTPALYLGLDPPFVVNFEGEQSVRFLQVTVQLMSRDPATIELLKANDPMVRNDLLMLFSGQKAAAVSTREGKEALRTQALASVRQVISGAGGHPEKVEAVYFTSFVMQ